MIFVRVVVKNPTRCGVGFCVGFVGINCEFALANLVEGFAVCRSGGISKPKF